MTDQGPPRQLRLAIDDVPAKVRAYGLRDAHSRPLVSTGKQGGEFAGSFRVPTKTAWGKFPSLELRAANSYPAIHLDCDGPEGTARLCDAVFLDGSIPHPNWIITRLSSGGSHAVWNLARPVKRGKDARLAPMQLFARVNEFLAHAVGADIGYSQVLTHNPMAKPQGPDLRTVWGPHDPYELRELAEIIPLGWRSPKVKRTAAGRNVQIFKALMVWAGSPDNLAIAVLTAGRVLNQDLEYPLDLTELRTIAASVERYRTQWRQLGQFGPKGDQKRSDWGRKRGKASGRKRRKRNRERDGAIVNDAFLGATATEIAAKHGLTPRAVSKILARDVPLMQRARRGRPAERSKGVHRTTKWRRARRLEQHLATLRKKACCINGTELNR